MAVFGPIPGTSARGSGDRAAGERRRLAPPQDQGPQPQAWGSHGPDLLPAAAQLMQRLPQAPHQRLAARQRQGAVAGEVPGQGGQLLALGGLEPLRRRRQGTADEAAEAIAAPLEISEAGFGLEAAGQLQGRAPALQGLLQGFGHGRGRTFHGGGAVQSVGIDGGRMSCSQSCSA